MKIFDCFRFFNEKELLELRYLLLKDKVEKFIILQGDKTHSGQNHEPLAKKYIDELGLPKDKFIIITTVLPSDSDSIINNNIDIILRNRCLKSSNNDNEKYAINCFTRERLVLDSILSIIDNFNDSDVFYISDCDEIINPEFLLYFSNMCLKYPDGLIKVPLVELNGQANFRCFTLDNKPILTDNVAYFCTKKHLTKDSPTQLRFNIESNYPIIYITENDERLEDCGWHFSWMGDSNRKKIKARSFSHYLDLINSDIKMFTSNHANNYFDTWKPYDGGPNPWGNKNTILRQYSLENLPTEILFNHNLRHFFINDMDKIPVIGVPIVNGVHWLERLLSSIDYPVKDVFIINNNGKDEIIDDLNKLSSMEYKFIDKIRVIHMPSNIGVAASWNLIIKSYLMSPYWIICNNDVSFTPGFLEEMISYRYDNEIGLTYPSSINNDYASCGIGSFECFLIKDWVIKKCGLFDENLYPAYCEDVDYILKILSNKIKSKFISKPFFHGETQSYDISGSQTTKIAGYDFEKKIYSAHLKNKKYLLSLWGDQIDTDKLSQNIPLLSDQPKPKQFDIEFNRKKNLGF